MSEHYYTSEPLSEIREKTFTHTIKNITLTFTSVSGVFAFGQKVDKASELIIKHFYPSGSSVLDVGCGYGAIGLFLKAAFPMQNVTMIDINSRAIDYTNHNAMKNNLNITAIKSDLYTQLTPSKFDDIVSNPPIAAGKLLNKQLIEQSCTYLNPGGALWLVAFHNKGGSALKSMMLDKFGNVEDIEKSGGIRVYKSVR